MHNYCVELSPGNINAVILCGKCIERLEGLGVEVSADRRATLFGCQLCQSFDTLLRHFSLYILCGYLQYIEVFFESVEASISFHSDLRGVEEVPLELKL